MTGKSSVMTVDSSIPVRPAARQARTSPDRYAALLRTVREAGLLDRCTRFYTLLAVALALCLIALGVAFVLLGNSWFQLLVAVGLGLVVTQVGFLAHEAAHREVCRTGPANDRLGRVLGALVVGVSFTWWKGDHNRHHATPNVLGRDPSIKAGVLAFTPEDAAAGSAPARAWYARQGWFLLPLLLFAGLDLRVRTLGALLAPRRREHRWSELALLGVRTAVVLVASVRVLPLTKLVAFLVVEVAVFGLTMALAFVPNHTGMPVLSPRAEIDFLERQVSTSRNIAGSWLVTAWMGGLNLQIEHHLFPSMPRPHLRRARAIVRQRCRELALPYEEVGFAAAYRTVIDHLNEVGTSALRQPYRCPTASVLGR